MLAAGGSTRMGRPKALLPVGEGTLLAAHVEALAAVCDVVRVVVGGDSDRVGAEVERLWAQRVDNPSWATTTMAESVELGMAGLRGPVLVTPVDVPPAPRQVLDALLDAGGTAVPRCGDQDLHPILLARPVALGDRTLRQVLADAPRVEVDWPDGARNMNTPDEWEDWAQRQGDPG